MSDTKWTLLPATGILAPTFVRVETLDAIGANTLSNANALRFRTSAVDRRPLLVVRATLVDFEKDFKDKRKLRRDACFLLNTICKS